MASALKSTAKDSTSPSRASSQIESTPADVQSYLISNYREALKRGDKSAAKSCLLAARYFSVNDPNVTNEIYIMAKSDGDISEAAKCFANIFNDLFVSPPDQDLQKTTYNELLSVISQMREETKNLLFELKSTFLKLMSMPAPATVGSSRNQVPSIQPSPMLSPRMRVSSEDKISNRESMSKLDNQLHSSTRNFFYQQLFDNLPEDVKKSVLDNSIETCDNPFERCRLMMLTMTIFEDTVSVYGGRLLRELIALIDTNRTNDPAKPHLQPRPQVTARYAQSLLVLDAIPLVLDISPPSCLDFETNEFFERTLNFYSDNCLEPSAAEYDCNELHEGLKKSIASRILGIEHNSAAEEATEEHLIGSLNLLSRRYIESLTDTTTKKKFDELRSLVSDKSDLSAKFDQLIGIIRELGFEEDIPDDILFAKHKEDSSTSRPVVTPPPKGRGRPKKVQTSVIVSLDDSLKMHLQSKAREVRFVFYSIVQHMFVNCASYLKSTRSRILMNFNNPLATLIESELAKSSSQRTSRSKTGSQPPEGASTGPVKKIRLETIKGSGSNAELPTTETPLNSEQCKLLDRDILTTLDEARKCLEFLNSDYGTFKKLWKNFFCANKLFAMNWFGRFTLDSKIMSGDYQDAADIVDNLNNEPGARTEQATKELPDSTLSTLTILPNAPPTGARDLRTIVQSICCQVQLADKLSALEQIDTLMYKLKQCGLMAVDDSYSSGNIIHEHMIIVQQGEKGDLGFLFFDLLSMMRYCTDTLMSVLKKYATNSTAMSDTVIGHTIVLSQFDWPREASCYQDSVLWLRAHKPKSTTPQSLSAATKFTYPEFFQYIRNPNIIEEFMAMLRQGYTLDIKGNNSSSYLPTSGSQARSSASSATTRSGKAITTRGVNKSFKEDLKIALTAQMRNSTVLVPLDLISDFIQTTLLQFLGSD